MLPRILLSVALILLPPWWLPEAPTESAVSARLPVTLVAATAPAATNPDGFDVARASRQVVEGTALRLLARGVQIEAAGDDGFLVAPDLPGSSIMSGGDSGESAAGAGTVTLAVGFNAATTRWASGSETRFGGEGDASWRLASRVQRHLVSGLWDVLGYDSYDRGIVQQEGHDPRAARPDGLRQGDPWVETYPLFATNPRERDLLEKSETLGLLSTALADAITDYLDPSLRTPSRRSRIGWRQHASWRPVSPRVVTRADRGTRVALTLDGGASSVPTPAILKALKDAGVRATMFMTADFVEQNPELVVQMARDGHEFGNHSSTHPDMTKLSDAEIVSEMERLETAVHALTGKSTRPWFRPPFGAYDDRVVRTVAGQGYYTVMWTADSADWRNDVSADTVQRRLLTYATPGAVIVQHLGSPQSAEVLPEVLGILKQRGLRFGTLSEVLGPLD